MRLATWIYWFECEMVCSAFWVVWMKPGIQVVCQYCGEEAAHEDGKG